MKDGGPAFPKGSISLRDWFAGMALGELVQRYDHPEPVANYAIEAYKIADAMLAEREKQP